MIALYDTNNVLEPKIQKKLKDEQIKYIESTTELIHILKYNISLYSKIIVDSSLLSKSEMDTKIIPLLNTSALKAKVLFYEVNSSIATIINCNIFREEMNLSDNKESIDELLSKLKKISRSKYKHVVIGVSTGGPSTLEKVIPLFPKDIDVSIVVIQHILRGNYIYKVCERLNSISQVEVKVAENGDILKKGVVYFPPPGSHLTYKKELNGEISLVLSEDYKKRGQSTIFPEDYKFVHIPSVDIGIESASDLYRDEMIAVILTGMGSDGAIALKYARDNGAYTISEDESTSIVYGMPKAAVKHGGSMEVLKHYLVTKRILELLKYKNN